jgi:hypothetical protein
MPLSSQTESFQTKEKLVGGEWVERGAEVAEDFNSDADSEGDRAKRLPELEAMVALRRLDELREALPILSPVKFTAIHDNTGNCRAMTADPLGSTVNNNVRAMGNGSAEITTSAESVVNLDEATVLH